MPAKTPTEINDLFQQYMRRGDLDAVMELYDPEAVFVTRTGEVIHGAERLREQLEPFAAGQAEFYFMVKDVIETGDIALTHNVWAVDGPESGSGYAVEVSRRQADGSWRWLIGDPFTVGRQPEPETEAGVLEEVGA